MTGLSYSCFSSEIFLKESRIVVLMGPPGSGKGTHAAPLSAHLRVPHISTGDLLREHIRQQTSFGKSAALYIHQGNLVPNEMIFQILFERVSHPDCQKGFILDGFPRTVLQAKLFGIKAGIFHVINLHVSDDEIIRRITGRLNCTGCSRLYHKTYSPPQKETLCDSCLSPLFQREDDSEKVIRKRLEVYGSQTEPLIQFYEEAGVLKQVQAERTKEEIFKDVLRSLSHLDEPSPVDTLLNSYGV